MLSAGILIGLLIFFLFAPRAQAYVGIDAGSFITQFSFGSFLFVLVTARVAASVVYQNCVNRIKRICNRAGLLGEKAS